MPIDRRTALGTLAAAGAALVTVPHAAGAESPDADLFALVREAKARAAELDLAEDSVEAAYRRYIEPSFPDCLLLREGDDAFSGLDAHEIAGRFGKPISHEELGVVRKMRAIFQNISCRQAKDPGYADVLALRLERATEIDLAYDRYLANVEAAKRAAGLPEAETECECDRAKLELMKAWYAVAFKPAKTREGVLAKLEAVADRFGPLDPGDFQAMCNEEDLLSMVAFDLGTILEAQEA